MTEGCNILIWNTKEKSLMHLLSRTNMEQLVIFNYHANVAKTDHALYAQKFRSGRNANLIMVISVEKELLNNFLN